MISHPACYDPAIIMWGLFSIISSFLCFFPLSFFPHIVPNELFVKLLWNNVHCEKEQLYKKTIELCFAFLSIHLLCFRCVALDIPIHSENLIGPKSWSILNIKYTQFGCDCVISCRFFSFSLDRQITCHWKLVSSYLLGYVVSDSVIARHGRCLSMNKALW